MTQKATTRVSLFTCLLIMLAWVAVPFPRNVSAQAQLYHMESYNAQITVNEDGSLDVLELLEYVFEEGSFKRGLREIPLSRVDSISRVRVVEEIAGGAPVEYTETEFNPDDARDQGVPGTFGTETVGNSLRIRWIFDETSSASRTFRVQYHVTGALQVYQDRYELHWKAVPPDWGGAISSGRAEVIVPGSLPTSELQITSRPAAESTRDGNSIVWSLDNPNDGLEVGVKLPKDALQAAEPDWQARIDATEKPGLAEILQATLGKVLSSIPFIGSFSMPVVKLMIVILTITNN